MQQHEPWIFAAALFLVIAGVSLAALFEPSLTVVYYERNGAPGLNPAAWPAPDVPMFLYKNWQLTAYTQLPARTWGLVASMVLSLGGFILSVSRYDRGRRIMEKAAEIFQKESGQGNG